ncbi:hypothetical protein FC961_17290 [Clostridium botulinum]|nr:hypothetical protein [Clostridium botulinum]NFO92934.1 hypothetical protein [Clostridium botulinum]
MSDYPRTCEKCGAKLDLDTDYEGNDIVTNIICPNNKCEVQVVKEYDRKPKDAVEKEYIESLK